jgi:hypothetical protein
LNHFTTTMLAFGIMVAALPTARAADTNCTSNLFNTTVNGNLIVPAGQSCQLIAVTVTGNVQVQTNALLTILFSAGPTTTIVGNVSVGTGARLNASNGGLTIDGNFEANQCLGVSLVGSPVNTLGGNVQIHDCTGGADVLVFDIGGNVDCNNSGICDLGGNKVNGNVEVNDNSSAIVANNTIGNNLECQGNTSITGEPNTVGGKKSGQCAGF